MEQKESLLEQDLLLTVVLPEGNEKNIMVHGSNPMMDLLVMLCAKYHLNPSSHCIELISIDKNRIKYKPNALIGTLKAEKVLLKPKGMEDRNKRIGTQMPEATVRLVINYKKTQKTILRVNPRLALRELLSAISEKCEFEVQNTVLLQSVYSNELLDLNSSLNDLGIRELYARDTQVISSASLPLSPTHTDIIQPSKDKLQKEKENKGLFGVFKRGSKKKLEQKSTVSAPVSPVNRRSRPMSLSSLSMHSPVYETNTLPADTMKKRRAPLPPNMRPTDLIHHQSNSETNTYPDGKQVRGVLNQSLSAESSLKRSKRKAPPPPTTHINPSVGHDETTHELPSPPTEFQGDQVPDRPVFTNPSCESLSPVRELLEDDHLSGDVSIVSGRTEHTSHRSKTASPEGIPQAVSCNLTTDGKLSAAREVNKDQPEPDAQLQRADGADFNGEKEVASLTSESSTTIKEGRTATLDVSKNNAFQSPATSHIHVLTQTQQAEPQVRPKPDCVAVSVQAALDSEPTGGHVDIQTKASEPSLSLESNSPLCLISQSSKADMGTSTEELLVSEMHPNMNQSLKNQTFTQILMTDSQKCLQMPSSEIQKIPQMFLVNNNDLQYATAHDPKTKPSEVGMTTYTIVPPKALEKLHFFEVALTLESPNETEAKEECIEALDSKSSASPSSFQFDNRVDSSSKLYNSAPSFPLSPEVKEKKVPPAIRPKPASFHLPQHNRTSGSYVNSAAVRSMSFSDSMNITCRNSLGSPQKETTPPFIHEEENRMTTAGQHIPPASPPQKENQEKYGSVLSIRENEVSTGTGCFVLPCQTSPPPTGLTLEKLRSFAAPKPYSPNSPSRFAQAVCSAVKKSQFVNHSPLLTLSHKVPMALNKQRSIREPDDFHELPATRDMDGGHMQTKSINDLDNLPVDDTENVWKRRTSDLSTVSACNTQHV